MGLFSSGSKYKYKAEGALASAKALTEQQSDIEFRRQLLSNIRQERIARAQLEVGNYSDDFTSSSAAGATANVDSSLAGESLYAYESSKRADQIQSYNEQAEYYNRKYQKAQKKKSGVFSMVGGAVGSVVGFVGSGFNPAGAIAGWQIGQGLGQVASKTGQEQQGIQNILSGAGFGYRAYSNKKLLDEYKNGGSTGGIMQTPTGYGNYETYGVNPTTGRYIPNTYALWMLPQTQRNVISILGGY